MDTRVKPAYDGISVDVGAHNMVGAVARMSGAISGASLSFYYIPDIAIGPA
jgi:hypothetical protein